jgi:hypothetical protein
MGYHGSPALVIAVVPRSPRSEAKERTIYLTSFLYLTKKHGKSQAKKQCMPRGKKRIKNKFSE